MYRSVKILVLAVVAVAALSSCFIPDGTYFYISEDQLGVLESLGMPIHRGMFPPDVTGAYMCNDLTRLATNIPGDTIYNFYDMVLEFGSQTNGSMMISYNQSDVETGTGLAAYVSGFGRDFTIYAQILGQYSGINFKSAMVISGTKTSNGIQDLVYSIMLTEKDYDPTPLLMNVGEARVIEEYDGLATNYFGPYPPIWTSVAAQRSATSAR